MKLSTDLSTKSTFRWLAPLLLVGGTLAGIAWVAFRLFQGEAFCEDEYAYLCQAKIFASGHLSWAMPQEWGRLVPRYMVFSAGKVFCKYPPLWAAALSLGERFSLAALVNPALSALTVLAVYRLALTVTGRRNAFLGTALLATNSYFVGYGASLFAQPLSLFASTFALLLYTRHQSSRSAATPAALGAVVGLLCLSRPADAFCLGIAIAWGLATTPFMWRSRIRDLAVFALIAGAGPALLILYNHILAEKPDLVLYPVDQWEFRALVRMGSPWETAKESVRVYVVQLLKFNGRNFLELLPKAGIVFPLLVATGLAAGRSRVRLVAAVHIAALLFIYNFHPGLGWPQYGQRYWYAGLGSAALIAVEGLAWIHWRWGRTAALVVALVAAASQTLLMAENLRTYAERFDIRLAVKADIFRVCPTPAVVVLRRPALDSSWTKNRPDMLLWFDFRRNFNGMGPHRYTLSVRSDGQAVKDLFPKLPVCVYEFTLYDRLGGRAPEAK